MRNKEESALFVPSYKRANRLLTKINTLQWISPEWMGKTFLVVREDEKDVYSAVQAKYEGLRLLTIPKTEYLGKDFFGWGDTMDWILSYAILKFSRFVIMDDDLKLSYRRELKNAIWEPMTFQEFNEGMARLLETYDSIPYMGWRERQFSDGHTEEYEDNARFIHVFGFYSAFFEAHLEYRYRNTEQRFMTDLKMLLSLLVNGVRTRAWMRFCHDDIPDAPGGCSVMRSIEAYNDSAVLLHKTFPDLVALRQKTNWGDARIGTIISWRKALKRAFHGHV